MITSCGDCDREHLWIRFCAALSGGRLESTGLRSSCASGSIVFRLMRFAVKLSILLQHPQNEEIPRIILKEFNLPQATNLVSIYYIAQQFLTDMHIAQAVGYARLLNESVYSHCRKHSYIECTALRSVLCKQSVPANNCVIFSLLKTIYVFYSLQRSTLHITYYILQTDLIDPRS